MNNSSHAPAAGLFRDMSAGMVVFLVALPLCLGIALSSEAPLFAGLVGGIVGGVVVGMLSGSHTSVSGPAAGLTAIVAVQITTLGFDAFLFAVMISGVIQIALGVARAGFIAAFFPSSVIKGLLAAIGVILILKQIPHVLGHDTVPEGQMAFEQQDRHNTFSELIIMLSKLHPGAGLIGLLSLALLIFWDYYKPLKKSKVPAPLVIVALGVGLNLLFDEIGGVLDIESNHLVQVPQARSVEEFFGFLRLPDFTQWNKPAIYTAGFTLAVVASLETLLNLEAVDKLDPQQRVTPPSRELWAQGVGNVLCGLIGGLPVTSVVVRGSVNINAGAQTKLSTIVHGLLLLISVMFFSTYLNMIPLSCLGAILLVTGFKLASPKLFKQMWSEGRYQFIPFIVTLTSIVLTDLLNGIIIGMCVSISFILYSNLRRPIRRVIEKHLTGEVLRIELGNQVSFLNRAALEKALREVPRGGRLLIDATRTHYIDPDILDLLRDFKETIAPAHGVQVSLLGFRDKYNLIDDTQFVDYSTRELQEMLTSEQILQILREGNERFRTGQRLTRDFRLQLSASAKGQHPLAVVLSCIDSRTPAELIFDLGLGDIFSVRVAGNVISPKILGSMEYGCAVAGAKLVLVMGHTSCGAVTAAVKLTCTAANTALTTGCQHLEPIIKDIQHSVDPVACTRMDAMPEEEQVQVIDRVSQQNVMRSVRQILEQSSTIGQLVQQGRLKVVGAMYDVATGKIDIVCDETSQASAVEGHYTHTE